MKADIEVSFDITAPRDGLRCVLIRTNESEAQICGTLGDFKGFRVLEGSVVEICGSMGSIRIMVPEVLQHSFEQPSSNENVVL